MIDETGISIYVSKYQQIVAEACKQLASNNLDAAERAYDRIKAKLLAGDYDIVPIKFVIGDEAGTLKGPLVVRVDIVAAGEPRAWDLTPWLRDIARQHGLALATSAASVLSDRALRIADYVYLEALPR